MILDEVAQYIVTASTLYAVAPTTTNKTTIWKSGFAASSPNTAVALLESGGAPPLFTLASTRYDRPSIQVLTRSTSYVTARTHAQRIHNLMINVVGTTLSSIPYHRTTPLQSPFPIGQDSEKRDQFSCNYIFEKKPS